MNQIGEDQSGEEETRLILQAALESANDAILITELNLEFPGPRIEYVNPAFTRMTLYTASEIIGQTPRILQGPKTDQSLLGHLRTDLLSGKFFHGQSVNYRKDGTEYNVEWRITPVNDRHGNPSKWLAVQRDVTDRVRAEEALQASEKHLRAANLDLEHFAFAASHDLQEPIRNVVIHSQLIERKFGTSLPPEAQEHFAFVVEGAKRVASLVQDLLAFTRTSEGSSRDFSGIVNAQEVLATVIADLKQVISETEAQITIDALPAVAMREIHLRQIFQNLLTNAIKYRNEGVAPKIHISAATVNAGTVQFAVQDNGIGIAPEYHEQVFGIFRRLHDRTYEGTGIGLAITQRIAERYGQRVWVESEFGKGSTFYFTAAAAKNEL